MKRFIAIAATFAALLFIVNDADAVARHLARAHARRTAVVVNVGGVHGGNHVNRFNGIGHQRTFVSVNRFNGIGYRNNFNHFHVANAIGLGYGGMVYGAGMYGSGSCQQPVPVPVPVPVDPPVGTFGAELYGTGFNRFNGIGYGGGFFGRHIQGHHFH